MKWRFSILFMAMLAIAFVIAAGVGLYGGRPLPKSVATVDTNGAGWVEIDWPYLKDQFGAGKAFACGAATCGALMRVTFRAKIGFCNCTTGVSDDEELARIGDVGLVGARQAEGPPGHEISVGGMKGRDRVYSVTYADGAREPMLSIAFNNRCDVIVATATGRDVVAREEAALAFLGGGLVMGWVEKALGL